MACGCRDKLSLGDSRPLCIAAVFILVPSMASYQLPRTRGETAGLPTWDGILCGTAHTPIGMVAPRYPIGYPVATAFCVGIQTRLDTCWEVDTPTCALTLPLIACA